MITEEKARPVLMTGNEAVAHAAVEAGLRFFAGYPITPSSEIAEVLATSLPKAGGVFIQMEDEIAAMSAVIGAAIAGAKAMTATSGPGFSLKQEAIGYACEAEVPCVVVNVMRGGPSTGLPTLPAQGDVMQARWGTHGDHPAISLCPESVVETYRLTLRAFDLSERLRNPVILLMDEVIGHVTEKVRLPLPDAPPVACHRRSELPPAEYRPYAYSGRFPPPLVPFGTGYRYHVTGLLHEESGFPSNDVGNADRQLRWLMGKVEQNAELLADNELYQCDDAEIILFSYGASARTARWVVHEARSQGRKVGLFRPRTIWPFPYESLRACASAGSCRVVVPVEMNLGQLAHEVSLALQGGLPTRPYFKVGGEPILPDELMAFVAGL
jgi:2-oxoglutarate ferredoxin oxidoreductase subunit alpha